MLFLVQAACGYGLALWAFPFTYGLAINRHL